MDIKTLVESMDHGEKKLAKAYLTDYFDALARKEMNGFLNRIPLDEILPNLTPNGLPLKHIRDLVYKHAPDSDAKVSLMKHVYDCLREQAQFLLGEKKKVGL